MLGYRLVQQRAFGVAWVVELGFCSDWHEYCTNAQYSAAIVWVRKAQGPNRRQFGPCQGSLAADLLARRRHIRAAAMRHFRRHADALAQRRMRVDGLADVDSVRTHLDGQGDLADHVARMRADHAAAQDLAVAPASMAVSARR